MNNNLFADRDYLEYLKARAIIEEHNANLIVEDYIKSIDNLATMLRIRFFAEESCPELIVLQLLTITKMIPVDIILFAVGRSDYLCFATESRQFFRITKLKQKEISLADVDKLYIKPSEVLNKIKCLFLEDKRRLINYENNKIS